MSQVLVTYSQKNEKDKYSLQTASKQRELDSIITNFIQELVTKKGSNVFDRTYGTLFIDNLGIQINVYKIDYFLKQETLEIRDKYGILDIMVKRAWMDASTGTLNIEISVQFSSLVVDAFLDLRFEGSFTEADLIEYS